MPHTVRALYTGASCLWGLHSPASIPPSLGNHQVFQITNSIRHGCPLTKTSQTAKTCQKSEQTEGSGSLAPNMHTIGHFADSKATKVKVLSEKSHRRSTPTSAIFDLRNVVSCTPVYSLLCSQPLEQGPSFPLNRQPGTSMKVAKPHLIPAELLQYF